MTSSRPPIKNKRSAPSAVSGQGNPNGDAIAPRIIQVDVRTLKPSPENALIYRERARDDSDFARLVESIRREDVQAPLLVSRDGYIVSGHQRQKAAFIVKKFLVPVIYLNMAREDHTSDEWLAILREHNCGREKSFDELVREKLVDIDPDEAVAQIVDDQIERTRARVATIDIGEKKKRSRISQGKRSLADAILKILEDIDEYLPVSLRAIHYRLLNDPPLRHANKPEVYVMKKKGLEFTCHNRYRNDLDSYKDLSKLVTRMRLVGEIPWDAICDETRPVTTWRCWRSAADFIARQADGLFKGYARDLLQSQQQHFEIVVEKLTVQNFVKPIASRYCMPVVIMRGNSGIDARHQIAQRFRASGKHSLFLFCLGDCDPDGDSIVQSTLRSLRDDFGIHNVRGTRVAMTHAQADGLHLPQMLEAKTKSPNYRKFVRKHGRTDCYELESVAPEVLQGYLDTDIKGVIDVEAYNHEVDQQTREAAGILAKRQAVLQVMKS
jgi:hypothetical protein